MPCASPNVTSSAKILDTCAASSLKRCIPAGYFKTKELSAGEGEPVSRIWLSSAKLRRLPFLDEWAEDVRWWPAASCAGGGATVR